MKKPKICLLGRPNVGKSSLFNRLVGKKKAIVLDEPGVTRDVMRTELKFDGYPDVELADLAGLEFWEDRAPITQTDKTSTKAAEAREYLKKLAIEAAVEYLESADLVLFVVDARAGVTPGDEELARLIRKKNKNVVIPVLSKVEGVVGENTQPETYKLGFGEALFTSAEHNLGIEELRNRIISELGLVPDEDIEVAEEDLKEKLEVETKALILRGSTKDKPIRFGVYGKPNVGKSTLVNQLLGEKRMITSPIAGTTVDTVDSDFMVGDKHFRILDTAGIRKKSKTEKGVEVLSVVKALKSLEDVEVALYLIDGYEGISDQDEKIAGEINKSGKATVIIVNKWDLCNVDKEEYADKVREAVPFLDYAPVLFISAQSGEGLEHLWELTEEMLEQRMVVVPTAELNRFFEAVEGFNNPLDARVYFATQTSKNPPTIVCKVNDVKKVHFAYERYLKNEIRKRYGWMGSPVKLIFRSTRDKYVQGGTKV